MNSDTWNLMPIIWPKVITRAWLEPAFRTRLLQEPKNALRDFAVDLPKELDLQVIEGDQPQSVHVSSAAPTLIVRLPIRPDHLSDEKVTEISQRLLRCSMQTFPF